MITIDDFITALESTFPDVDFYNGCINKNGKCVGVYARGNAPSPSALGGKPSYRILPVTMLIHWGENSKICEAQANVLYEGLENGISTIKNTRVIDIDLVDSCPVNIGRDDNNICEMTIRLNLYYERR